MLNDTEVRLEQREEEVDHQREFIRKGYEKLKAERYKREAEKKVYKETME
jgi:hypothetical protein